MNPGAGKADPYWYEWNVGLEKVVDMLGPDSPIASVEFQKSGIKGWDDVVVRLKSGRTEYYQVKHSRTENNLTFGSLVQGEDGVSLLSSLFDAWKKLGSARLDARFIVQTNREAGTRKSSTEDGIKRPALVEFMAWLGDALKDSASISAFKPAIEWERAWAEWRSQLEGTDEEQYEFLKVFVIKTSGDDSAEIESRLIGKLEQMFATTRGTATGLFQGLTGGLRQWTTARFDRAVQVEDAYQALALSSEEAEVEAAPPPPTPFFKSRQEFLRDITAALQSGPKVLFLCGEPGAGKTSLVSSLTMRRTDRGMEGLVGLRYFAYRPITVASPVIPADADEYVQPKRLWYTLLSQLRNGLRGRLVHFRVPVRNDLISWAEARTEVLRIAHEIGRDLGREFVIAIDGIDHAARASRYDPGASKAFFDSLPGPDELSSLSVRLMAAGQPPAGYPEYPHWITCDRPDVRRLDVGKLADEDLRLLLASANAPLIDTTGDAVVRLVREETGANTLASVFAADEARHCRTIDELRERLSQRRLKDGLIQYYRGIWGHATASNVEVALPVACLFFVARERITVSILTGAFPGLGMAPLAWQHILDALDPLLTLESEGYRVRHNDVRVFLHSLIESAPRATREATMGMIFDYYWKASLNRLAAHRSAFHLAKESGRLADWPRLHNMQWIFEAAALGIPGKELMGECATALTEAAKLKDWDLMLEVTCAAETLEAWEDRCAGGWLDGQILPERAIPYVHSEVSVTPVEQWTNTELDEVLHNVFALLGEGEDDRARGILVRWFGGMTLAELGKAIPRVASDHGIGGSQRDARCSVIERIGRSCRYAGAAPPETGERSSDTDKLGLHLELGWADASSSPAEAKNLDEAFAGRLPRFYAGIDKAVTNFAREGAWHLVKEALEKRSKNIAHFSPSFLVRAAWRSLRSGVSSKENPWIAILAKEDLGLKEVEEDKLSCALDVARALGWTRMDRDSSSIARQVFEAENGNLETNDRKFFVAIYRAAALIGRITGAMMRKGPEAAAELAPPKELRQVAEALWSEGMHGGLHRFEHRRIAGELAVELVKSSVGLSEEHRRELLEAAANLPKFQWDDRKESLWELYRRTGNPAKLKQWVDRWLGPEEGWLWYPDTSSKEPFLEALIPLAEELGEADLAEKARARAAWQRITYRGHKDYSFRSLHWWLKALGKKDPLCWRDLGVRTQTLRQAARQAGCDNEYGTEIQELIGCMAYRSGPDDLRRLILINEDPRDGEERFYGLHSRLVNGAVEFFEGDDVLSTDVAIGIWCLVLGWSRWHDRHSAGRLKTIRQLMLARVAPGAQRRALEETLQKISPVSAGDLDTRNDDRETKLKRSPDGGTAAELVEVVRAGKTLAPTAAVRVVKYLNLMRPVDYDALVSSTLSQVGNTSPYGSTWSFEDAGSIGSLQEIAALVGDEAMWHLVSAAQAGIGRGSVWLQGVTENLFDVLLARADASGPTTLRTGIEKLCDMHERWLRGGKKAGSISVVTIPAADPATTWDDAVETSLDVVLGSYSSEVVASGLEATHAWITAKPGRIEQLFHRWDTDDWRSKWLLTLAERWATEHPSDLHHVKSLLETIARNRALHLRLQAWLVLVLLAKSRDEELPQFPENPNYQSADNAPLFVPPRELMDTPDKRVGSSNFVDRFGAAESVLGRVAAALDCSLSDIETKVADEILRLPKEDNPTTFPAYLHADGDIFCSVTGMEPVLSAAFEQKLADEPLESAMVIKFAHGFLNGEDPWIVSEPPRKFRDESVWPPEKLLEPGYQVPTDRQALERACLLLALESEVPEDEIVIGAKVETFRNSEDFEFLFWYEESVDSGGIVLAPKPVTTINSRTFPLRCNDWFEKEVVKGRRPLVHFAGSLTMLHNSGVQIIPARLWKTAFAWNPRHDNPLEWISDDGLAARYERIHGPLRMVRRGHFRQPLLARWLFKKTVWKAATEKLAPLRPATLLRSFRSDAEQ